MWQSVPGAGVLAIRDGHVLMVLHERDGVCRWELPSGIVEHGESLEVTAARETLEETGVRVSVGCLLCTVVMDVPDEAYRGINAYFRTTVQGNRMPRLGDGEPIHDVRFVDLSTLRPRDIHPVDRRILNMWRRKPDRPPYHIYIKL